MFKILYLKYIIQTTFLTKNSCCNCLASLSDVETGRDRRDSILSCKSFNSLRSCLFSRSKEIFSVSKRSRFPHSAAFSA